MDFIKIDINTVHILHDFYESVYKHNFPKDELMSYSDLLAYITEPSDGCIYNVICAMHNNELIGGCIFDYFPKTNIAIIEFIVVKSTVQSMGYGNKIYEHVQFELTKLANLNGHEKLRCTVIELDQPLDPNRSKKYLYFWKKHGFNRFCFNYIQPPLNPDTTAVDTLWLATNAKTNKVSSTFVKRTVGDYIHYCMNTENIHEEPNYLIMEKELDELKTIWLEPLTF